MASISDLQKLTVVPAANGKPTAAYIFLHGVQGRSSTYDYLAETLHSDENKSDYGHIDIIIPDAPLLHLSASKDDPILEPAWYDLVRIGESDEEYAGDDISKVKKGDIKRVLNSVKIIEEIVELEISKGVKPERIVLAGFSQGAAMTFGFLATSKYKLAGAVAIAGMCPAPYELQEYLVKTNRDTPILQFHGTTDEYVDVGVGKFTRDYFEKRIGFTDLTYIEYEDVTHVITKEELTIIYSFLKKVIPK